MAMNHYLNSNSKHNLFTLASYIKNYPKYQNVQRCSTAASFMQNPNDAAKLQFLPVPPLEKTLDKYLLSVRPFLNVNELQNTRDIVHKFLNDENRGQKLQKLLEDRARTTENWLSEWWLNTAYLEYRDPVVVYSSPGLVWPMKCFKSLAEQLAFTAKILHLALTFNAKIEKDELPEEKFSSNQLCMDQYYRIFGTCRIPDLPRDRLVFQDKDNPSTNVIVMYNNHVFSFPAFVEGTRIPLNMNQFYSMLVKAVGNVSDKPGPPVGILTTENRDNWAKVYKQLMKNPTNIKVLKKIEKALFVVCVDQQLPLGAGYNYDTRCSKLLLHGFGMRGNAGNRWYDKTLQFVVGANDDGLGITYEHSPAEGGPIGVLSNYILENINSLPSIGKMSSYYPEPEQLVFDLSSSIHDSIQAAGKAIDRISDELDVLSWSFNTFGATDLKNLNVSPDSFIQVAIQYAFYKLHQHPGAQYESASLRQYLYGRTETIRSCTQAVVEFCDAMCRSDISFNEKNSFLLRALSSHKMNVNDCINGRGIDRHLLGLKLVAKENNIEDELFTDVAYTRSTHFQLSTSNVSLKFNGMMVYGPLVEDGYACCYNVRSDRINFGMSAWSSCRSTFLNAFKNALFHALVDMEGYLAFKSKL